MLNAPTQNQLHSSLSSISSIARIYIPVCICTRMHMYPHAYVPACICTRMHYRYPQLTGATSAALLCKCHRRLYIATATPRHALVALTGPMAALLGLLGPRLAEPLPFHYACHILLPLLGLRYANHRGSCSCVLSTQTHAEYIQHTTQQTQHTRNHTKTRHTKHSTTHEITPKHTLTLEPSVPNKHLSSGSSKSMHVACWT